MFRAAFRAFKAYLIGPDAGQGRLVRLKLKINRLLGPRAPTNELAHRVAPKSQKRNRATARGLLAYDPRPWRGRYTACPGGMTPSALIAKSPPGPSPFACTSASLLR